MKENILYAYHVLIDNITEYREYSVFEYKQKKYYFTKWKRSLEEFQELLNLIYELQIRKIPAFSFIINVEGNYLTNINEDLYVLIEVDNPLHEYGLTDMLGRNKILRLNRKKSMLYRNNWKQLWSEKVDYLEYQISEMGKKYPIILNSFSYFAGLAENAICYLNNLSLSTDNLPVVLAHRRVSFPNLRLNYDNPLNFIFDVEVRDVAEYIKSMVFINEELSYIELKAFLDISHSDFNSLILLYARLLYPSYYFDLHEKIINEDEAEESLLKVIDFIPRQEIFLKKAWNIINDYIPIPSISWLIEKEL